MRPLVSCLTATHGRWTWLREAITCFVKQGYPNKELIILNNHEVPLICELPQVKIYNQPGYETLGHCRMRLLELANGEFLRTWDDDDLYLPWAITQGVEMIGDAPAWKPQRSWHSLRNKDYELNQNVYEASITFRKEVVQRYGYQLSGGDEHHPLMVGLQREGCKLDEMESWASYVYRWGTPLHRISGTIGSGTIEERTAVWKRENDDHGDGRSLELVPLGRYWKDLNDAIQGEFGVTNPVLCDWID